MFSKEKTSCLLFAEGTFSNGVFLESDMVLTHIISFKQVLVSVCVKSDEIKGFCEKYSRTERFSLNITHTPRNKYM